jgi:hypothetical protein
MVAGNKANGYIKKKQSEIHFGHLCDYFCIKLGGNEP